MTGSTAVGASTLPCPHSALPTLCCASTLLLRCLHTACPLPCAQAIRHAAADLLLIYRDASNFMSVHRHIHDILLLVSAAKFRANLVQFLANSRQFIHTN